MTDAGKTLSLDATKALIEALAFRDFSRWRREDDYGWHDMTFALGLGYGYRLYAHPGADRISRPTEFELVHDGGFMLCSMMEFSSLCRGCLELGGLGCSATLRLDRTVDPEAYADSIAGTVCKDRVTFTKYGKTKTTHVYASEAPYAGDDGRETESHGLSWEFKQGLMRAAYAQDYSWIDDHLDEFWDDKDFQLRFWDKEETRYCSRYSIEVYTPDSWSAAVEFSTSGLLCRNSDGLLLRSDDAVLTIPVSDGDMERFRRETGFMDTRKYLSRHPFRSYAIYARSGSGNQGGD